MRDGARLAADVYRPETARPLPAILVRLPYNKDDLFMHTEAVHPVRAAEAGYAVVYQDTRGRFRSEGSFYPFVAEGRDGYDTVEWLAAQPWCDGNIGMAGASYFGATQWLAAVEQPPHLKAIFPIVTSSEYYEGWTYQGGAFQLGFALLWTLTSLAPDAASRLAGGGAAGEQAAARLLQTADEIEKLFPRLPLGDLPDLSRVAPYYRDWIKHESRDDYWEPLAINRRYGRVRVPAFHVGAWYDLFLKGTLENYRGMRREGGSPEARQGQRLLIAPWSHGNFSGEFPGLRFGTQASAAGLDLCGLTLGFFDRHLKGLSGQEDGPPVRLFVMGANRWREEAGWPLPGARSTAFYLHSAGEAGGEGGSLSLEPPAVEPLDHYLYDPRCPTPTLGGPTFLPGLRWGACAGPQDQRPVESRPDVLTYTSEPLQAPLEVIGPLQVNLWAASSAEDTDFVARLCDVAPDGTSRLLAEGILRARYREGFERPLPLIPGQPALFRIDLAATANLFLAGHRIRVDICSSSFPRFSAHPNLLKPLAEIVESDLTPAWQQVYHQADYPSHILLPLIERE